jgi:hypothetical protein
MNRRQVLVLFLRFLNGLTTVLQWALIGLILFAVMLGTMQAFFGWPT